MKKHTPLPQIEVKDAFDLSAEAYQTRLNLNQMNAEFRLKNLFRYPIVQLAAKSNVKRICKKSDSDQLSLF